MTIEELPPANFFDAEFARGVGPVEPVAPRSGTAMEASASAGGAADGDGTYAAGEVSGQLQGRRGSVAGCVSADARMAREPSARVTASAQFPMLLSSMVMGLAVDRDVEVALSSRPEYARAPVSRAMFQVGFAFLDFQMRDTANGDVLRMQVMPVAVATTASAQTVEDATSDAGTKRVTTEVSTAMLRLIASDDHANGTFDVFRFGVTELPDLARPQGGAGPEDVTGFVRLDILGFDYMTARMHVAGSGGFFVDDGDCPQTPVMTGGADMTGPACPMAGAYDASFAHAWKNAWLQMRLMRSAFIAADDTLAIEDRASTGVSMAWAGRRAALTAFTARTRAFLGGPSTPTGGAHLVLTQDLDRHFAASVDAEVARGFYGVADGGAPEVETTARVLAHLDWHIGRRSMD